MWNQYQDNNTINLQDLMRVLHSERRQGYTNTLTLVARRGVYEGSSSWTKKGTNNV